MDEVWLRLVVVAAALGVAGLAALVLGRRSRAVRRVDASDLPPGIYFFSSRTCSTCEGVRIELDRWLGADGYTEWVWEHEPDPFERYGVDVVPATLVVDREGGHLHPGRPDLASLRDSAAGHLPNETL